MSSSITDGYICEFRVRQDNNMILPHSCNPSQNSILFLFHVHYILRKRCGVDEVVDSTGALYTLDLNQPLIKEHLEMFMALNFSRWGLPHRVRETLYEDVASHVHRMKNNPENIGCTTLPIDVGIDVYTVQKEGEDVEVTRSRLIKSGSYAFVLASDLPEYQVASDCESIGEENSRFVDLLERVRVEVGEFVQECSICLEKPCVGAEICYLPCTHVYHFKCIVRWLEKSRLCPFCRAVISN